MSDYITKEEVLNLLTPSNTRISDTYIKLVKEEIKLRPSADVVSYENYKSMERTVNKLNKALQNSVEVVRCKDCKYWHEDRTNDEYFPEVHECTYPLDGDTIWTFEGEYCSNGERKDGDKE